MHKEQPKNVIASLNIAKIYYEINKYEEALTMLELAKKNAPNNADILLEILKCKTELHEFENEEECEQLLDEYNKLINNPDLPLGFSFSIAKTYAKCGKLDEALEYCEKAIEVDTEDIGAYRLLGLIQLVKQDYKSAKNNLNIALGFEPKSKETHNIFSYVLCHQVDDCPLQKCREKYYKLIKKYLK